MSTVIRPVQPTGLATGVPYSYGAIVEAGARLVLLAGACPLDADGRTVAAGDVVGQTRACMDNARVALAASGAALADVVFVRTLVATASRDELSAAWEVVRETFGSHEPAGTLQGVTVLGWADQLVEVELIAAVAAERSIRGGEAV